MTQHSESMSKDIAQKGANSN